MQTKKSFNYWQWRVIICTMIGYSMFYFVRKNFSFAMPALKEEFGITNTSFGIILTIIGIIYGVSKFINGIISDRSNARWHLSLGLAVCVAVNFAFGWSAELSAWITGETGGPDFTGALVAVIAVLLIVNNIFQGCGFGPCNHLMVNWVPTNELATKMSVWNTSHSIGAGIVSVLCGSIIGGLCDGLVPGVKAWQWCFWIPALIGTFGVFFIIVTLRDTPRSVGLPELPDTRTTLDENDSPAEFRKFLLSHVLTNKIVWILAVTDLFVYIVRFAVLDWGPTFLKDKHLSPQLAGWTIGIFEIAGCVGMLLAGWMTDKFFKGKAHRMCFIEMMLVAVCMLILQILPADSSPVLLLVILALSGFFLYGPQALLGVTASKHATKKAASTAVGIIGLMSYASVIFTGAGLGWFSDRFGWDHLFGLMCAVAVTDGLIVLTLWNIKDDGYIHDEDEPSSVG